MLMKMRTTLLRRSISVCLRTLHGTMWQCQEQHEAILRSRCLGAGVSSNRQHLMWTALRQFATAGIAGCITLSSGWDLVKWVICTQIGAETEHKELRIAHLSI